MGKRRRNCLNTDEKENIRNMDCDVEKIVDADKNVKTVKWKNFHINITLFLIHVYGVNKLINFLIKINFYQLIKG
jgi:hypothetical protein